MVGTRTVEDSERLSQLFETENLPHQLLNARQDAEEAAIIAEAGEKGRVTIATNMAGRGTDIKLTAAAEEAGGLHVIVTERQEAGRIDRQLVGRSARQGDPGSVQEILSLEDELASHWCPRLTSAWVKRFTPTGAQVGPWVGDKPLRVAQRSIEKKHMKVRQALQTSTERTNRMLAFAGKSS